MAYKHVYNGTFVNPPPNEEDIFAIILQEFVTALAREEDYEIMLSAKKNKDGE